MDGYWVQCSAVQCSAVHALKRLILLLWTIYNATPTLIYVYHVVPREYKPPTFARILLLCKKGLSWISKRMAERANYQAAENVRRTEEDAEIRDRDVAAADRDSPFGSSRSSIKCIVWLMRIIFFTLVTGCLVLSKLTIIEKFARINQLVNINRLASSNSPTPSHPQAATDELRQTVNLYWQLLFIIMIPSILTWLYSIFKGILSNSVHHPWPKKSAIALVRN